MRRVKKKEFHLSQDIRREVKEVRQVCLNNFDNY